jgi:hypothetical protein
MRGAVLYGPRDVRFEERDAPAIIEATDAIVRIAATSVCGSDLWPYRGIIPVPSRPLWSGVETFDVPGSVRVTVEFIKESIDHQKDWDFMIEHAGSLRTIRIALSDLSSRHDLERIASLEKKWRVKLTEDPPYRCKPHNASLCSRTSN